MEVDHLEENDDSGNGFGSTSDDSSVKTRSRRRARKYKLSQEAVRPWLKQDNESAFCTLCNRCLENNISTVERHSSSRRHRKKEAKLKLKTGVLELSQLIEQQEADAASKERQLETSIDELLISMEPKKESYESVVQKIPKTITRSCTSKPIKRLKNSGSSNDMKALHGGREMLLTMSKSIINLENNQSVHEFDMFCNSLAIQLKKMPLRNALICQKQLQEIVTAERLSLISPVDPLRIIT